MTQTHNFTVTLHYWCADYNSLESVEYHFELESEVHAFAETERQWDSTELITCDALKLNVPGAFATIH